MSDLCTERVNRGDSRWSNIQPCGRPAKEDGLCSLHLKVRERRREKEAKYAAKMARHDALRREADRLSAVLGIAVGAEYNAFGDGGGYTGNMVVPLDWLQTIANERGV